MVLRKREPKKQKEETQDTNIVEDEIPMEAKADDTSTHVGFIKPSEDKIRTFHDQACMVLDILEEQGINIYDPKRYPGMYLHHDGEIKPVNLKDRIVQATRKQENVKQTPVQNGNDNTSPKNKIINFFKNRNDNEG